MDFYSPRTCAWTSLLFGALAVVAASPAHAQTFAPASTFLAGTAPIGIATGDLDGDGVLDLAVANTGLLPNGVGPAISDDVTVLLGDGTGQFSVPMHFAVDERPSAVAIADMDNDGKQDLIVAHGGNTSVWILFGNHMSSIFDPPVILQVNGDARAIAVGHFNTDGHRDLAIATLGSPDVSVVLGLGNRAFASAIAYAGGGQTRAIAVADLDQDGDQDLIAVSRNFETVALLFGDGLGAFPATTVVGGLVALAVAVGDFNHDSKDDFAVATAGATVVVFIATGGGAFTQSELFAGPGNVLGSASLAVADVDGDCQQDLISGSVSGSVTTLRGLGDGSFGPPTFFDLGLGNPWGITTGDFDADGRIDIAVAEANNNAVGVLVNTTISSAIGGFFVVDPTPLPTGISPRSLAAADLNSDGHTDLVAGNAGSSNASIYLGQGNGSFVAMADVPLGVGVRAVHAVDINHTGTPDLVATSASLPTLFVRHGNGDGTFDSTNFDVSQIGQSGNDDALALADFDNNGWLDYAVAQGPQIYVGFSFSGDSFNPPNPSDVFASGGVNATGLVARDLDGDGDLDIATSNSEGVCVLMNAGGGSFGQPNCFDGQNQVAPKALVAGDFNGDQKIDLAIARNTLRVYLGNGDGTFATATILPGPLAGDVHMALGDLNLDGRLDLAVAHSSVVEVRLGTGTGLFGPPATYPVGDASGGIVIADFNADCKPDIAVGGSGSTDFVTMLFNQLPDQDHDGIGDAVDRNRVTNTDESLVASDDFNDGVTSGAIADRAGWNVLVGDAWLEGVRATLTGEGSGPAVIESCFEGTGPEQTWLDVVSESATITCAGGTSTVTALLALPAIEIKKMIDNNLETKATLATGDSFTQGSPMAAGRLNVSPIPVSVFDGMEAVAAFELDPGEIVDVTSSLPGTLGLAVLAGAVTFNIRGQPVTLPPGSRGQFLLVEPLTLVDTMIETVAAFLASGEIRNAGAARSLMNSVNQVRHQLEKRHDRAAAQALETLRDELERDVKTRKISLTVKTVLEAGIDALAR